MQLDAFTVLVASCTMTLLMGLQFVFFWNQDRQASWLAWCASPFFVGGAGVALFPGRGILPDMLTIGASNALLLAAFALAWQAVRIFEGRPPRMLAVIAAPALWLLLCTRPDFMASVEARVVAASLLTAGLTGLSAFELWRGRAERLPSRPAATLVFASFAVLMGLRVPLLDVLPFPMGGGPLDGTTLAVMNLLIFVHTTSVTVLMVSMTKERRESEQRSFALCDSLTGLLNRRAFHDQAKRMARRRRFGRDPLGLLVLDLDHFKQVNDRYGHAVGDRVLISFAQVALDSIRPTDLLFRMGGEEFCCLLPDASIEQAFLVAERIRKACEASLVDARGVHVSATVSIGVASSEHMGHDIDAMYGSADAAVYAAKAAGRNRTVVAGSGAAVKPLVPLAGGRERRVMS